MSENNLVVVVRAILTDFKGRTLFTRREADDDKGGSLCLPGGKLDPGESHVDGLHREVLEEVQIEPESKFRYCFSQEPVVRGETVYRQDYFCADVLEYEGTSGEEVQALRLLMPKEGLHPRIAFNNGVAFHFEHWMRMARFFVREWSNSNEIFQSTGSIPALRVFAPSHHPIDERKNLARWVRQTRLPDLLRSHGPSFNHRYLTRTAALSNEDTAVYSHTRTDRAEGFLDWYALTD